MVDAESWIITSDRGNDFTPFCPNALKALFDLDKTLIGTAGYLGHAYFWAWEYRHYMRPQTQYRRRLIHKHLCMNGLELSGVSDLHKKIIMKYARFKD